MRTENIEETFGVELPTVSSAEIARIIGDARRMRAETQAALLRSAGRGVARLGRRARGAPRAGAPRRRRPEPQAALRRSAGRGVARLGRRAWVTLLAAARPTRG